MALSPAERQSMVNYLVTNCDCWQNQGDREVLSNLSDEKLALLKSKAEKEQQAVAVANTAANGFKAADGNFYRVNPETGKWERRVDATANAKKAKGKTINEEDEEEDEEMEEDEEEVTENRRRTTVTSVSAPKRPRTTDEWIRQAPVEVQNTFKYAQRIEQNAKDQLIGELLTNIAESDRPAHREWLLQQSLDHLHNMKSLMPKRAVSDDGHRTPATTNRNGASRNGGSRTPLYDNDMLEMPKMPWEEVSTNGSNRSNNSGNGNGTTDNRAEELVGDASEEEWLSKAPPGLQSVVRNAMQIEQRERERLIDEITANADEETVDRLRTRLRNKSLEELKDFKELVGKRGDSARVNYFGGAAASPTLSGIRVDNSQDDVLPLPAMDWKQATNGR